MMQKLKVPFLNLVEDLEDGDLILDFNFSGGGGGYSDGGVSGGGGGE
ncbi:hypothetical protein C5167_001057 [Papaver somniferum]|uniref:Uncharacterized protein n=1 Tax=Papaver somniferum TaxID=3469 RepID=A0A4Y7KU92_PAPSO|nr:hypothetical protein C5167_001057 [Papaver somniferum]